MQYCSHADFIKKHAHRRPNDATATEHTILLHIDTNPNQNFHNRHSKMKRHPTKMKRASAHCPALFCTYLFDYLVLTPHTSPLAHLLRDFLQCLAHVSEKEEQLVIENAAWIFWKAHSYYIMDIQLIAKIFMARSVGGCDFSIQRRRSA